MRGLSLFFAGSALILGGCTGVTSTVAPMKASPGIKKVAVVSFSVNDWSGLTSSGVGSRASTQDAAIQRATNELLNHTEKRLSSLWTVKKAETFVGSKDYRRLTVEKILSDYVPVLNGKELGALTQESSELKKVILTPEQAKGLCAAIGVDAIMVVYSEWRIATGNAVPISRAKTLNLFSFYDKQGERTFYRRVDKMGTMVIGGADVTASIANAKILEQWAGTYRSALDVALAN
ncbi:MAG: hypothetical protein A2005_04855 [Desulfuromonadales bacterium GWC2_61_20]|nr:MAG: hypothetical protein A2005_04855 [Desulfuromonadales bacterium GWC2_61_20]HAD03911.1 hypothetical protein [Desulfuromonas sp.]